MSKDIVKAWYFAPKDERLGYGDGRPIVVGETHSIEGIPICCVKGLHGSIKLLDALKYANSSILYRVEITGNIHSQQDKIAGTHRRYLKRYDISKQLKLFSKQQALINIEKIKPYCTTEEYNTILAYLNDAAASASESAWEAAGLASELASESAGLASESASESARAASWAAASWEASWVAARLASESARLASESAASWEAANQMLEGMLDE